MMTLQQILEAIEELSDEERQIVAQAVSKKPHKHRSILELAGLGTGVWGSAKEIDDYINKMRDEWDEREQQWR